MLANCEKSEIMRFKEVFYIGNQDARTQRRHIEHKNEKVNDIFDTPHSFYRIILHDHLKFRYEILKEIDKGSFG